MAVYELATVIAIDGQQVIVESAVKSACSGCQQVDNCGSGQVAKAFPQRKLQLTLRSELPLSVGDVVKLALPEKDLLSTAWQVYLWPIFGLMLFAFIGQWALQDHFVAYEWLVVIFSGIGGYLGFWCARQKQCLLESENHLQPKIVSKTTSLTE